MSESSFLKPDQYLVTHDVGPGEHGWRLDQFLKDRYRRRSRQVLKAAIDEGAIQVRREQSPHLSLGRLKASTQLLSGDQVLVTSQKKAEPPVNFNYRVLFEDDTLLVVEKPAHLPVHPSGRYFFHTLLTHLKTEGLKNPLKYEELYYLVHRIDKETSGVLLLAKTKSATAHLVSQFANRDTEKRYHALVIGDPEPKIGREFECDLPLGRDPHSPVGLKMNHVPLDQGGQTALTRFRKRATRFHRPSGQWITWLECFPKTGRQHQIRIHLDLLGFPILGDKLYGRPPEDIVAYYDHHTLTPEAQAKLVLDRHALHSYYLTFEDPRDGTRRTFETDLPEDLKTFFDGLEAAPPSHKSPAHSEDPSEM